MTFCVPIARVDSPLVPVPSEANASVATPDLAPAVDVSKPIDSELLLVAPAPSCVTAPLTLRLVEPVLIEAFNFSENPSLVAALDIDKL